jgi:hypothetical protein
MSTYPDNGLTPTDGVEIKRIPARRATSQWRRSTSMTPRKPAAAKPVTSPVATHTLWWMRDVQDAPAFQDRLLRRRLGDTSKPGNSTEGVGQSHLR